MLTEVISNQTSSLKTLNLNSNDYSSVSTEKILTRIAECGVCSTLKVLNLQKSTNLDSDESVRKLADILAIAPVLEKCYVTGQKGERKVSIEVEYMTEGRMGNIVMRDKQTE